MVHLDEESPAAQVLLGSHLREREDGREADPARLACVEQVLDPPACEPLLEMQLHDVPVLRAADGVLEQLELRPFRPTHELDEPGPLVLLDHRQEDQAVRAAVDAPRVQQPLAEARRDLLCIGVVGEGLLEEGCDEGLGGQVDVLPASRLLRGATCGERSQRPRESGLELGLAASRRERRGVALLEGAGAEVAPAAAVHEVEIVRPVVAVGPREPERRDRAQHQARIQATQLVVHESVSLHVRGRDVVDQDVGARDEALERVAFAHRVEAEAALVRVQVQEEPALLGVRDAAPERPAQSRAIAARRLDLHHVGAEISDQLGGVRGRHTLAHLDHADALEPLRSTHRSLLSPLSFLSSCLAPREERRWDRFPGFG